MKTTLSMQCGAPYIPIPKGRGFTANPDNSLVFYDVIIPHINSFVNNHSPGI